MLKKKKNYKIIGKNRRATKLCYSEIRKLPLSLGCPEVQAAGGTSAAPAEASYCPSWENQLCWRPVPCSHWSLLLALPLAEQEAEWLSFPVFICQRLTRTQKARESDKCNFKVSNFLYRRDYRRETSRQ